MELIVAKLFRGRLHDNFLIKNGKLVRSGQAAYFCLSLESNTEATLPYFTAEKKMFTVRYKKWYDNCDDVASFVVCVY